MSKFKPMLASTKPVTVHDIQYPVLATPKLDGVRCVMQSGPKQRSLKPVRNLFIQDELKDLRDGPDGELTVGLNFHKSSGDIRRSDGEPDFTYWVFDDFTDPTEAYETRLERLADIAAHPRVKLVLPILCNTPEELQVLVDGWVAEGFEGAITRTPGSPYKCGRSTLKQGWMLKIKDFVDEEATVLDTYEWMHNANEATTNLLGRTERSSHKENLVPTGMLGGFVLRSDSWEDFRCGSMLGVTHEERKTLWEERDSLVGKLVKFKYQSHGSEAKPRLPIFLGFRDSDDT
jgi:DNA ligase 1